MEPLVHAVLPQEIVVSAAFDDPAAIQNEDEIGVRDGG